MSLHILESELCHLWLFLLNSNLEIRPHVCPGGTDSRFIRSKGIPALGFSPINNTPILLHDHDEYIRADSYLHGIEVYTKVIPAIANV